MELTKKKPKLAQESPEQYGKRGKPDHHLRRSTSPAREASKMSPLGTFLSGIEEPKSEGSRSIPSMSESTVQEEALSTDICEGKAIPFFLQLGRRTRRSQ